MGVYDINHHNVLLSTNDVELLREAYLIEKENNKTNLSFQIGLLKHNSEMMIEVDKLRKKLKLKPKYHKK